MTILTNAKGFSALSSDLPRMPAVYPITQELYNGGGSLKRLFLFEEGVAAAPANGPYLDSVSGTSPGILEAGNASPLFLTSGGLACDDVNGFAFDAGTPLTASFTVAAILRSANEESDTQHIVWHRPDSSPATFAPADPEDSWTQFSGPHPTISSHLNNHGIVDGSSITSPNRISSDLGPASILCACAFRVDGPRGIVDYRILNGGYTASIHEDLVNFFSSFTSVNHLLGLAPTTVLRPTFGDLELCAVWNVAVPDEALKQSLRVLADRVVKNRARQVFGYSATLGEF